MSDGDDNRPARLPGEAPQALRDFVACTADRVDLDLGDLGWIPKPEGMGALPDPSVEVDDGWTPTAAMITVGYGYLRLSLPATIVDGQLRIDTSNLDVAGVGPAVDRWVEAFNRTLGANDKQLDTFEVRGNRVALTKRALAVAAAPATAVPVASATDPAEPPKKRGGCLAWVLGGLVAIAAAVGITLAVTSDDADAPVASDVAPTTTAPEPTTTSATTTTVAQVGQAPPTEAPEDARVCGDFPDGTGPGNGGAFLNVPDGPPCAPGPDSFRNGNCDPLLLPCSDGSGLLLTMTGDPVGTDHTRSVPDAATGEDGNSTALFAFLAEIYGDDTARIARLISECGGDVLTGETEVSEGEVDVLESPLQQFGSCTILDAEILIETEDGDDIIRPIPQYIGEQYTITDAQPPPGLPRVDDYVATSPSFSVREDWAGAALTINGTFAAGPFEDDCLWFWPADDGQLEMLVKVLDGCSSDRFWVFAAATTDVEVQLSDADTLVGVGGAEVVPIDDTAAFNASMFDNTAFPCGFGDVAYTACPDGGRSVDAAAYVSVSAATNDTIPIEGDETERTHQIDFAPARGPTFTVAQGSDGWMIESSAGDTRARAIFRDNSVTLIAPRDELPAGALAYVWRTTVDGNTVEQPVIDVAGSITLPLSAAADEPVDTETPADPPATDPPATDPPATTETIEDFYARLSPSIASGDLGFSLDRLHPTVIEAYPDSCPAALESFADPDFAIDLLAQGETGPWTWQLPDGRSFDIDTATTVTISLSGRGQSGEPSESHLAIVDGQYRWFTFC